MEARGTFGRTGLVANQSPITSSPLNSVTPASAPSANQPLQNRPPVSIGNIPQATVKVEPMIVTSMVSGSMPNMPSVPRAAFQAVPTSQSSSPPTVSQEMITIADTPEVKPMVSMSQSLRPVGAILNNLSHARVMNSATQTGGASLGLPSIGGNPMGIHISNMISSSMASSAPLAQTMLPSGQSSITSVSVSGTIIGTSQSMQNIPLNLFTSANPNMPGMAQQLQPGLQNVVMNNNSATNTASSSLPSAQSKYVKVWEGSLSALRQGQPVLITRLEGYRNTSASETLAANWPPTMQIIRLISQDHMNSKQYVGKADFPVFRAMNQHGFLQQLQEKKLCAVIQLPSQTLLLSVSEKACRLIGMLFPRLNMASSSLPSAQSKYVKVWKGSLWGQRQGHPAHITRLEGYRNASASETLAANWPPTMEIIRLISKDHMKSKRYVGIADFLVFRAMKQHGFLEQLQERELCAVIRLPSQTLLLSVSNRACRLIGMLLPGRHLTPGCSS